MELRQLEYFKQIADTHSFNEAARHLNMSQPPLSYQIRQLEEELGVQLFERTSKGVTLTNAGEVLYERAGNLLDYADSAKLEVAKAGKKRVLRIGMTSTTTSVMMPFISTFAKGNPDVNFEVRDGTTYTLYSYLMDGIIDISVARTPLRLDKVNSCVLFSEPMIAVSALSDITFSSNENIPTADNPNIYFGKNIQITDLAKRPLILYRRYEKYILDAFHAKDLEPEIFCMCDDAKSAMLWAKEGLATAVFPKSMQSLCTGLHVQEIDEPNLITQIVLIWKKEKKVSSIVQEFLDVCLKKNATCTKKTAD